MKYWSERLEHDRAYGDGSQRGADIPLLQKLDCRSAIVRGVDWRAMYVLYAKQTMSSTAMGSDGTFFCSVCVCYCIHRHRQWQQQQRRRWWWCTFQIDMICCCFSRHKIAWHDARDAVNKQFASTSMCIASRTVQRIPPSGQIRWFNRLFPIKFLGDDGRRRSRWMKLDSNEFAFEHCTPSCMILLNISIFFFI